MKYYYYYFIVIIPIPTWSHCCRGTLLHWVLGTCSKDKVIRLILIRFISYLLALLARHRTADRLRHLVVITMVKLNCFFIVILFSQPVDTVVLARFDTLILGCCYRSEIIILLLQFGVFVNDLVRDWPPLGLSWALGCNPVRERQDTPVSPPGGARWNTQTWARYDRGKQQRLHRSPQHWQSSGSCPDRRREWRCHRPRRRQSCTPELEN